MPTDPGDPGPKGIYNLGDAAGDPLPLPGRSLSLAADSPYVCSPFAQFSLVGNTQPSQLTFHLKLVAADRVTPSTIARIQVTTQAGTTIKSKDGATVLAPGTLTDGIEVVFADQAGTVTQVAYGLTIQLQAVGEFHVLFYLTSVTESYNPAATDDYRVNILAG
jgi:hypothetical protein